MELAALIGISIVDFWEITPFELDIWAKGYSKRIEMENDINTRNNAYQAYLISRWVWAKKVDIKKYLKTDNKPKIMTDMEMLRKVKELNALFGGFAVVTEEGETHS